MSKYKYQKEFLFSNKKLQEIQLFIDNEQVPLDLFLIRDAIKNTVIHHCSYHNQFRALDFYIKYYRKNLQNKGCSVADIKSYTKKLLDQKNNDGYTGAHYAAFKGNIHVLKLLEKYQANLQLLSSLGMNVLHFAAQGDRVNSILYLHAKQLDLNSKDLKSSTPLHWASYSGSQKIVQYLLAQPSVRINQIDQDGHTALHIASSYGHRKIVKLLLFAGADRTIKNLKGQSALMKARENQFQNIQAMLNDKYTFIDYVKFICNAKIKYKPQQRSFLQPIFYFTIFALIAFINYFIIQISTPEIFLIQSIFYLIKTILYISLIKSPKKYISHHEYDYYSTKNNNQLYKLCMECKKLMKKRENHCKTCHRCVYQYDHHCKWINNCVGKHNVLRFNVFLIVLEISLLWVGFLAVKLFILIQEGLYETFLFRINPIIIDNDLLWTIYPICIFIFLILISFALPLFCLILVQNKNLLLGKTTYERFSKTKESILSKDGSLLNKSWQKPSECSLSNCCVMYYQRSNDDKQSDSNSTNLSFARQN